MKKAISILVAMAVVLAVYAFPTQATDKNLEQYYGGTGMEQKIAAIGEVTCDNFEEQGAKIEALEAEAEEYLARYDITVQQMEKLAPDYIKNYYLLLDARKAYDLCAKEKNQQLAARLWTEQKSIAVGETVLVEYSIRNISKVEKTYAYTLKYNPMYLKGEEGKASVSGEITLVPGAWTSLRFSFVTRQGGRAALTMSVTDQNRTVYPERKLDLAISGAGCYLGCTHNHSTESDGSGTFAQNFYYMIKNGMSLTYTADHMPHAVVSDTTYFDGAVQAINACGYPFVALKGGEITVYDNNGHMLSYGNKIDFTSPPAQRTQDSIDCWNRFIDQINDAGGYAYLAHPFCAWYNYPGFASGAVDRSTQYDVEWYDEDEKILDIYTEMTGVEIINTTYYAKAQDYHINNLKAIAYWQRMNCKGYKKYFGSGGSDGHSPTSTTTAYNGFLLDDLTTGDFTDAHRNGRFFVTTRPEMKYSLDDKTFGETLITDKETARLTAELYCDISPIQKVVLHEFSIDAAHPNKAYNAAKETVLYKFKQGEEALNWLTIERDVAVQDGHFYILVVHADRMGVMAISNPIWVFGKEQGDVNGDQAVNAADALEVLKNAVGTAAFDLRKNEMGDMDQNSQINAVDALKILQKAVGITQ